MFVNKYKIRINSNISGTSINIPINLTFGTVDQAETVEKDFVTKEINKSINPIVDYEKVRFSPISNNINIKHIQYNLNLLNGGTFPSTTMYSHAGFEYDDIKYLKNRFTKSFLRLSFYDSDIPSNQNLVTFITLFCRLTINDIKPLEIGGVPVDGGGLPNPINQIPIRFIVDDPIEFPNGISEGYYLYHYKNDVNINKPFNLYMRATWNNASTGESIHLITDNTPKAINDLVNYLHMKYVLKRSNDTWYYEIDTTYSNNIITIGDKQTIELYQIQAL